MGDLRQCAFYGILLFSLPAVITVKIGGTIECLPTTVKLYVDRTVYPSECTLGTTGQALFTSSSDGGSVIKTRCTVTNIADCSFTPGTQGCGCTSSNASLYSLEYNFDAQQITDTWWTATINCNEIVNFEHALTLPNCTFGAVTTAPPPTITSTGAVITVPPPTTTSTVTTAPPPTITSTGAVITAPPPTTTSTVTTSLPPTTTSTVILTSPEPFPVGPVVGAVVAVLVVIVIAIIVIVIVWRRRRHSHNPPKPQSTGTPSSNIQRIPTDNRRALPKIAEDVQQIRLEDRLHDRKAVSMDLFPVRMDALHQDSNRHFLQEYQELLKMADSMKKTYTAQVGELPVNSIKNRNQEVLPYDHTRVKLFAREEGSQDYINASYVKGLRSPCDYIATQAPLISTVLDFWKMVWEQRSSLIIMLSEDTQSGTELYWPNKINRPVRYGDVEVTLSSVSVRSLYTARQLTLQANGEEVSVTQYQLHEWQAASARRPLTQVCDVLSALTPSTAATTTAPVIVHCSDGTAGTCTFIVLDILQGYIKNHGLGEDIDVFTIILNIVKCRPALLQSEAQYMFIHDVARVMVERKKREGQNKGNVYENAEPGQSSVYDTTYVYVEDSRHYETLGEVKEKVSGV